MHVAWLPRIVEFPSDDVLLHGLKAYTMYVYVGADYLNGLINRVTLLRAYVLERYTKLDRAQVEQLANSSRNRDLKAFDDDVIILACEKEFNRVWFFWFDCDVSDCCIGWANCNDFAEAQLELEQGLTKAANLNADLRGKEREDWEALSDWVALPVEYTSRQGYTRFNV